MRVVKLYKKISEKGIVEEVSVLSLHKEDIINDYLTKLFWGSVPVLVQNKYLKEDISNLTASIILENDQMQEFHLLDTLENENIKLEVVQTAENSKMGDGGTFSNGLHNFLPRNGIFIRVVKEGKIDVDDELKLVSKIFKVKIITLSDLNKENITKEGWNRKVSFSRILIPDSEDELRTHFQHSVYEKFDIIITTGGTGIGSKDITPETIRPLLDKEMNGIMDFIRMKYGAKFPNALTSRGIAGVAGKSLVYCLPGSQKAVKEYMAEIIPTLKHSLYMINDVKAH